MKLLVIGCGQCGGRLADEFARLSIKARAERGIEITTGVFAVNTNIEDLGGLSHIRRDDQHRILIGSQKAGGHGVGKINEVGAEIARDDGDSVIDAVKALSEFPDTDAILLISSSAGGTGSGAIPVLTQQLKERYLEKPVYNLIVLPFRYEEMTEERTIYNTATCLKSVYLVADAVFLIDNHRYGRRTFSIRDNLSKINTTVVEPFYDLLCAGEERRSENIGAKILDAGDIIQTLLGWTVIGHGKAHIPRLPPLFSRKRDFRDKLSETNRGIQALHLAVSDLSVKCNPADAQRALYLISAPAKETSMEMIRSLGTSLKSLASDAIIRSGDYPRRGDWVNVMVILSEVRNMTKIANYFSKAIDYIRSGKRSWMGLRHEGKSIEDTFREIPSLLQ